MKTIVWLSTGFLGLGLTLTACRSPSSAGTGASPSSSGAAGSGGTGGSSTCPAPDPKALLSMSLTGTLAGATINDVFALDMDSYPTDGAGILLHEPLSCGGAAFLLDASAVYPPDGGACVADGSACDDATPCCNNNCDSSGVCEGPGAYSGLFRMPTGGSDGGDWFCANQATAKVDPTAGIDVTVSSLVKLGACPGTPVSGSVTLCASTGVNGDHTACSGSDSVITSTLAGASFTWTDAVDAVGLGVLGGPQGDGFVAFKAPPSAIAGAGSQVLIELGQVQVVPNLSGPVTGGVLRIGPGNPDAGAVYCIGGGTLTQAADQTSYAVTFTNLSRLGTCSGTPVDGSLSGHVVTSP